jgi:hypothetical protein
MTKRVDFQQVCLQSLDDLEAKAKEDECKEIVDAITRLAGDIEAATNGSLKAFLVIPVNSEKFWVILKNLETGRQETLAEFTLEHGGYPVHIAYPELDDRTVAYHYLYRNYASDEAKLEKALRDLLRASGTAEIIYTLKNGQ